MKTLRRCLNLLGFYGWSFYFTSLVSWCLCHERAELLIKLIIDGSCLNESLTKRFELLRIKDSLSFFGRVSTFSWRRILQGPFKDSLRRLNRKYKTEKVSQRLDLQWELTRSMTPFVLTVPESRDLTEILLCSWTINIKTNKKNLWCNNTTEWCKS